MGRGGEGFVRWGNLVGDSRLYATALAGMESVY